MLLPLAAAVVAAAAFASVGVESIEEFHKVSDKVATGGQPTPEQVTALADAGFNAIVNLREDSEYNDGPQFRAAREAGIRFVRVPVSMTNPTDASVAKFLAVTDEQELYPVYVYCAEGNRAAAYWMIRRVLRDHWTLEKAEAEAVKAGLTKPATLEFVRGYVQRHPPKGGAS
jgi:uncharacterized protein (TIGR01244 family)